MRFHLGGVPFYLLYSELPGLNLRHWLSPIGVTLLSTTGALVALFALTQVRLKLLFLSLYGHIASYCAARRKQRKDKAAILEPEPILPESILPEPPAGQLILTKESYKPPRRPKRPPISHAKGLRGYKLPPASLLTPAKRTDQTALRKGLRQQQSYCSKP